MAERLSPIQDRLGAITTLVRERFSPTPPPLEQPFHEVVPADVPPPPPFEPVPVIEPALDPQLVKKNPKVDISGLPQSKVGAGRMFENFDSLQSMSDNPYFGALQAAMPDGEAPVTEVAQKTGLPPGEFVDLARDLKGIFALRETPGGLVFENIQYKAYKADVQKREEAAQNVIVDLAAD